MAKKELTLVMPIGDWEDEYLRYKADVSSEDAVIERRLEGNISPAQLGRFIIIARELNETKPDIIPQNKPLLNIAASLSARRILTKRQEPVETPGGKVYDAPSFVGPVSTPSNELDGIKPFVRLHDPEAIALALGYLERAVPGHIWRRLLVVAANDGNIEKAAQIVHDKVDEMVERLMEPVEE